VVHQGSKVRWAFGGVLPHTTTADDGSFDSGIVDPGTIFTATFDELGTFSYSCLVHPSMTGTVTVVPIGEEIPPSRSGISSIDAREDGSAVPAPPSRSAEPRESAAPAVLIVLLLFGVGIGLALGILAGVERSVQRRTAPTVAR
jgi:hypothetical protein